MRIVLVGPDRVFEEALPIFEVAQVNLGDAHHCLRLGEAGIELERRFGLGKCTLKVTEHILTDERLYEAGEIAGLIQRYGRLRKRDDLCTHLCR